jgi:serine/threonine protein kinase
MNLEQFEFYELLGKGAFDEVYRALNKSTGEIVSIKCISIPTSQQTSEWKEEIEIVKRFDHPNIIKYYGNFEDSGKIYLVTEYVDRDNLSIFIKDRKIQNKPLSERLLIEIISQIASALKHIHQHKVIHLDLKSSNILLTLEGDAKITGFSTLNFFKSSLKEVSTFASTFFYMSPELLSGQFYSSATDIWSFGILLYELITFDILFKEAMMQFAQLIRSENVPKITQHYSSELQQLTSDMLNKDPIQRISASGILGLNFIQDITSKISSQIETSLQIEEMQLPEEYFKLGKQALAKEKFNKAEDFLILAIKGGFRQAVNKYIGCVNEGKFKSQKKFDLEFFSDCY